MNTMKYFLMAALALTTAACSSIDDELTAQQPAKTNGIPFTATISIGESAMTRALEEDGVNNKIIATWKDGEEVALIYDAGGTPTKTVASVTKQTDGTATISANLEDGATNGSDVTIIYPATAADGTTGNVKSDLLSAQDGTLTGTGGTSIAEKYDVRKGIGKLSISGGTATVNNGTAGTTVSLTNQNAIFKFTVKNAAGDATIDVSPLTVTIGNHNYVITPASPTSELYAALPAVDGKVVSFSATGYIFTKANVTFAAGKYYQSTLKMTATKTVNLSTQGTNYTAQTGDILTGTLDGSTQHHKISIADGAIVTLDNVTINGVNHGACSFAGITCEGDATIILKNGTTNSVKGFRPLYPGIQAAADKTLTILGTGSLTASSFDGGNSNTSLGAGIGGGQEIACGNIVIQGGNITAIGSRCAAGIGGGYDADCGNITISGGNIRAYGGPEGAAGIGGGCSEYVTTNCGDITITDGVTRVIATLNATNPGPNSIGAGRGGQCGKITIGGTEYWDGSDYQNGGDTYLTQSTITYPASAYLMAATANGADKGKLICTDGHMHAYGTDAGCTKPRVAKIFYVGTTGHATYTHGLALALADEGGMQWGAACTACNTTKNTSTPVTDATWLLASKDQWDYMISSAGGYGALCDGFENVGGTNMVHEKYWSSTEKSASQAYCCNFGMDVWDYEDFVGYVLFVRACLAF